jgi:hypothetical protein
VDAGAQQRGGDAEAGQLRRAEVPDHGAVGQQEQRLRDQGAEGRQGQRQDLPVVTAGGADVGAGGHGVIQASTGKRYKSILTLTMCGR